MYNRIYKFLAQLNPTEAIMNALDDDKFASGIFVELLMLCKI